MIGFSGIVVLLGALDTYVIVGMLRDIVGDLQIPVNRLERLTPVVTGYLLGYVAAMPLLGQASDRFGRKLVLQLCLAGFAAGSVLTALSDDVVTLASGRLVQGISSGALLPVTMALAADLWSKRRRATVLGGIGAAQELGSLLGPLYGVALAASNGWRTVFWVNVPLAVSAMFAVAVVLPRKKRLPGTRPKIDVLGGMLLATALGLLVAGLDNPDPRSQLLPPWGAGCLIGAAAAIAALVAWELRTKTRLIDTKGVSLRPFFATLSINFASGTALMVTLVDVDLFSQTLLNRDDAGSILLLLRFLVALPIGAITGGFIANRYGEHRVIAAGMLIAAGGYLLIANWPADVLDARYPLGLFSFPRLDALVVAGLGLGLVIAPASSVVLRVVPASQHGVASAGAVVARMTGMLIGVATLSAWGLHRFQSLTSGLATPIRPLFPSSESYDHALAEYVEEVRRAMLTEYREIFLVTTGVCVLGVLVALLLGRLTVSPPDQSGDSAPT
ncbi:MFS transporter [Amycolatopsis pretoriensis]|uniref:MFS transporter n=1 Tax=Amycolatopsis pretoriensis TaxID=218821 RepID=UPI0031345D38